jgi:hypothetical protein
MGFRSPNVRRQGWFGRLLGFQDEITGGPSVSRTKQVFRSASDLTLPLNTAINIIGRGTPERQVFIRNFETSIGSVRLGDRTVNATRGTLITPGQTIVYDGGAELWAFVTTTTIINVQEKLLE